MRICILLKNKQNAGILLLSVVSHLLVKIAESFATNNERHFKE